MSSDAIAPAHDRILRGGLWAGAVAMCAFPKTAPCARALFTVGVIASVGRDVNRLGDEARALRVELAGVRRVSAGRRGDVDRRCALPRYWLWVGYGHGRADERQLWEKRADDLEPPDSGPTDDPTDSS